MGVVAIVVVLKMVVVLSVKVEIMNGRERSM